MYITGTGVDTGIRLRRAARRRPRRRRSALAARNACHVKETLPVDYCCIQSRCQMPKSQLAVAIVGSILAGKGGKMGVDLCS